MSFLTVLHTNLNQESANMMKVVVAYFYFSCKIFVTAYFKIDNSHLLSIIDIYMKKTILAIGFL